MTDGSHPYGSPTGPSPYRQNPYAQPGFGDQPPAQAFYPVAYGYAPPTPGTNGLAVASMVVSIAAIPAFLVVLELAILPSIVGVVLGFVALHQIRKRPQNGRGMALAGVIVGFVGLALSLLVIAALFVALWSSST